MTIFAAYSRRLDPLCQTQSGDTTQPLDANRIVEYGEGIDTCEQVRIELIDQAFEEGDG